LSSERRLRSCLLAAALSLCTGGALAQAGEGGTARCTAQQPWPPRFTLEYTVVASRGGLSLEGENELQFRNDGGQYSLNSSTRSVLYRARQDSRGSVLGRVLKPAEYVEQNQRREATTTTIDWPAGTVRFSAAPDSPGHAAPMLQDRLSMLLQVGEQVRHQREGDVVLAVAGVRSVAEYRFERRGKESVELPAGTFEAVRLLRRDSARNEAIEVWLAPSACWLPVKLRYTDDRGYVVENLLRRAVFD
jgi:hypothetical protein